MLSIMGDIRCVDILESYNENINKNIKNVNIQYITNRILNDIKKMNNMSLFEIISSKCSPYFDIETIPYDKPSMILLIKDAIIKTFRKYSNITINKSMRRNGITKEIYLTSYIITENKASTTHNGLSYHIIFPNLLTTQTKLKAFSHVLNRDYPEYARYIDQSVYSKNRLFRFPYQAGINPPTKTKGRDIESVHIIKYAHVYCDTNLNHYIESIDDEYTRFKLIQSLIISDYHRKQASQLSFNYDRDTLTYIRGQTPKESTISLTTRRIKDEEIKQIYNKNDKNIKSITDDEIYNRCIIINELTTNELYKNKLNEFIQYYNDNNKSFNNFRLTPTQINGLLSIIETKI